MSAAPQGPRKRTEGENEPILDPGLAIIDTHHHFYDQPSARYMFDDLRHDLGLGHNVVATVYVETQAMARPSGPEVLRPLGEIEFANGVAAMSATGKYGPCRVGAGIVGFADLSWGDRVAELLDRAVAAAPDRFRGIRQVTVEPRSEQVFRYFIMAARPTPGMIRSDAFREGFAQLAKRDLSFDASVFHHQLPDLADLADAFPDTTIVLNHMGIAEGLGRDEAGMAEVFAEWRTELQAVASRPNVVCKVGGLGLPFWGFGFEERADPVGYRELAAVWRPYVLTAIEAFGVDRCMMESNFPPDGRSCGYVPMWNALKAVTGDLTAGEREALFNRTASRVYRIAR